MASTTWFWIGVIMLVIGLIGLIIIAFVIAANSKNILWWYWVLLAVFVLMFIIGFILMVYNWNSTVDIPALANSAGLCKPVCAPVCGNEVQQPPIRFTVQPPPMTFEFKPNPIPITQNVIQPQYAMVQQTAPMQQQTTQLLTVQQPGGRSELVAATPGPAGSVNVQPLANIPQYQAAALSSVYNPVKLNNV